MRSIPLLFIAPLMASLLSTAALAQAEVIEKTSPHDVTTTIDQLVHAVEEAGASIIARVDHSGAAADAGLELRPTELLIFGNPQLGTPLMQEDQRIGLEVPLRVLAYEDANGQVHLVYKDVAAMTETYGLEGDSEAASNVSAALERLTDAAVAEQ